MGAVNLPNNIQNGDPLDADEVMANDQALAQVINGELEAVSNVAVAAGISQNGQQNLTGSATTLARSDHTHTIQGFENLASDPTTGNFVGRLYLRTGDGVLRYCTNASGSGTFITIANQAAADVPIHAAQHATGGHDPLPANIITTAMRASQTPFTATLSGDVLLNTTTWVSCLDLTTLTTTGIQTVHVVVNMAVNNTSGTSRNVGFRIQDVTAGSATIYNSDGVEASLNNVKTQLSGHFHYVVPAGGARTLRLQAGCATANVVSVIAPTGGFLAETFKSPTISAVIV